MSNDQYYKSDSDKQLPTLRPKQELSSFDAPDPANLPLRFRYGLIALAQLLVIGAIVALAVGFWHRREVDALRQRYLDHHGTIDIPEALYFDEKAASVRVPVLVIWLALQAMSALVCGVAGRGARSSVGLIFWALWLVSWLGVIELTFSPIFG